ncbi:HNH endonuclease [Pseudomonas sp. BP8]|uniref:HNH endonuclease n=1 Tax=Pseudomonas sp. BP8 TaxID=2817864 RepID=UPI001AE786C6|nr:HNH endonuclease [Pseudomonas sp. BP8]MBP2263063.1 putative restriction endonuclease [Pseudomonas sp. BP8]HDS1736891.1 HNH endonuclease [Pseudomonas putida]
MPVVIVENDTSQWEDETGAVYHFPKRYQTWLAQGTEVIYYKGRIKDKSFASARLSDNPHYFGKARIGKVYADSNSDKGDLYALIENFMPFESAVPAKIGGMYLETIPANRVKNYWRDGVRPISQADFDSILSHAKLQPPKPETEALDMEGDPFVFESANEGSKSSYFGTRYERRKDLRTKAIAIHGLDCKGCGFGFEQAYGEHAKGFIHVHHVVPISAFGGEKTVNPETDLVTLCANCHAVVHRKRDMTLSVDELKGILRGRWVFDS